MAKKKKKKELSAMDYLSLTFLICMFLSMAGMSINKDTFIVVFILLLVLTILSAFMKTPLMRGKIGELRISLLLKSISKKRNGKVINDIVVVADDKSSQLDHILIDRSGIYVIETKNYSGRIYGRYDDNNWTQVLAFGNKKNKMYNPVKQNKTHVYRLMEVLHLHNHVHSLVVFVKGNIEYIDCNDVYSPSTLKRYLKKHVKEDVFSDADVNSIYEELLNLKKNPMKSNKEHVKDIKTMRNNINANICPNCKIPLVLRTSRDGSRFYGCSNYPNCKFTKKI